MSVRLVDVNLNGGELWTELGKVRLVDDGGHKFWS